MYKSVQFTSQKQFSKAECMECLAEFLNSLSEDDIEVVDIEKEFSIDTSLASYKPRIYLTAVVIYKCK